MNYEGFNELCNCILKTYGKHSLKHPFLRYITDRSFHAEILLAKKILSTKKLKKNINDIKKIRNKIKKSAQRFCEKCINNMLYRVCQQYGKIFHDSVHGSIDFDFDETLLIDTCYMQRLKYISQTHFLYHLLPGARHSRFEHSLGVCYWSKRLIERLEFKRRMFEDTWLKELVEYMKREFKSIFKDEDNKKIEQLIWYLLKKSVAYAGLLHDIGHGAFSHALEGVFETYIKSLVKQAETSSSSNDSLIALWLRVYKEKDTEESLKEFYEKLYNETENKGDQWGWKDFKETIRNTLFILICKKRDGSDGFSPHEAYAFKYLVSKALEYKKEKEWKKGCLPWLLECLFKFHLRRFIGSTKASEDLEKIATFWARKTALYVLNRDAVKYGILWYKYSDELEKYRERSRERGYRYKAEKIKPERFGELVDKAFEEAEKHNKLFAVHDIVNSPFDADKLDYLSRDAYFAGIVVSRTFNTNVIESSIRVEKDDDKWRIVFEEKAANEILNWLFGREYERSGIYTHHVINACLKELRQVMVEFYEEALKDDKIKNIREGNWVIFFKKLNNFLHRYNFLTKLTDSELYYMWPVNDPRLKHKVYLKIINNSQTTKNSQRVTVPLYDSILSVYYRLLGKKILICRYRGGCDIKREIEKILEDKLGDRRKFRIVELKPIIKFPNVNEILVYVRGRGDVMSLSKYLELERPKQSEKTSQVNRLAILITDLEYLRCKDKLKKLIEELKGELECRASIEYLSSLVEERTKVRSSC